MGMEVKDANLIKTAALPSGANSTYTAGIDLGASGDRALDNEFRINAPALTTTELPDAATVKYSVQTDNDVAFGSATNLLVDVLTQTGAGGAGAAAATWKFRLPTDAERHVRIRATGVSATLAATKNMTFEALF